MGREIRRVPKDWDHPSDEKRGGFVPLIDKDYESACREWWDEAVKWHTAPDEELEDYEAKARAEYRESGSASRWYWEWSGSPPDNPSCYRPAWTDGERTHYQIYENVSEGTPCSPVFETLDEMIAWMVKPIDRSSPYNRGADWQCLQGRTREQAESFAKSGYVCSFVHQGGRLMDGVTAGGETDDEAGGQPS